MKMSVLEQAHELAKINARQEFKIKQLEDKIKRLQTYNKSKTACRSKFLQELNRSKYCIQMQGFKCEIERCRIDICPFKSDVIHKNKGDL